MLTNYILKGPTGVGLAYQPRQAQVVSHVAYERSADPVFDKVQGGYVNEEAEETAQYLMKYVDFDLHIRPRSKASPGLLWAKPGHIWTKHICNGKMYGLWHQNIGQKSQ